MNYLLTLLLLLSLTACSALPEITPATETALPAAATSTPPPIATPTVSVTTTVPALPGEDLALLLSQALRARDFNALLPLMGERFSIAVADTSLTEYSASEALTQLQQTILIEGSTPTLQPETDVAALLGGIDPLSLWGPVADPVRAIYLAGLGPNATGDAILVIGQNTATGQFYWHGLLLPANGNFLAPTPLPGAGIDFQETDVEYLLANTELNLRTGPGLDFAVEGMLRTGEIAQVVGKSLDGAWWLIICTQDASGYCWVTADPLYSQPTTQP